MDSHSLQTNSRNILESIVYRNAYEKHGLNEVVDALRTQDGDYIVND